MFLGVSGLTCLSNRYRNIFNGGDSLRARAIATAQMRNQFSARTVRQRRRCWRLLYFAHSVSALGALSILFVFAFSVAVTLERSQFYTDFALNLSTYRIYIILLHLCLVIF